jgi:hypothetical protein
METTVSKRMRRFITSLIAALVIIFGGVYLQTTQPEQTNTAPRPTATSSAATGQKATTVLETLAVKGRAPKTGYSRDQFGSGWAQWKTCNIREKILARDLKNIVYVPNTCKIQTGTLEDPYTGKVIAFQRGSTTSQRVQIDHVVALSDAWQKGAQQLPIEKRKALANDDLNLLAADGPTNMQKGAGDAATWLPKNKGFRCQYVARQIAVKAKYALWVTTAEKEAIKRVLSPCPEQTLPAK